MRCTSAAHPAAELADLVCHGSMSSTPAGVVCPSQSTTTPHYDSATAPVLLRQSVCRRTGPGMCIVYKPLLARPDISTSLPGLLLFTRVTECGSCPCLLRNPPGKTCMCTRGTHSGPEQSAQHSDRDAAHLAGPGDWSIGPSHDRSYRRHSGAGLALPARGAASCRAVWSCAVPRQPPRADPQTSQVLAQAWRARSRHGHCRLGRQRPDRTDLPAPRRPLKILQRRHSASLAFTETSPNQQPLSALGQLFANCPALLSARAGLSPGMRHRRRASSIAMLYRPSERWVPIVLMWAPGDSFRSCPAALSAR